MKKEIMVAADTHHDESHYDGTDMSEELQNAIQNLIHRMRELGPMQETEPTLSSSHRYTT